jgi:hypothetical protein
MSGAPASYDLNAVFDALQELFHGLETGEDMSGQAQIIWAYSEVVGGIQTPAVVLELDDIAWDQTMGDGQDAFTIMMTILVQDVSTSDAQRQLRSFLSRAPGSGLARIKKRLEDNKTLGGLVSFVEMGSARQMGKITYDAVDYMGIALPLEVVS